MSSNPLIELESWLGHSVGDAYATALEVAEPAGTSGAWKQLLEKYEVTPGDPEAARRAAAATGLLRGASVDELYAVLDKITKLAEKKLDRIEMPDDGPGERQWRRLQGVIGRLRDETVAAYRAKVMPKRTGGMFGAAKAAAMAKKGTAAATAPERKGEAFVMRCEKCGAPRLKNDDFVCEYCDTPYARDGASPLEN
jgi:hypothetical protein